MVVVGTVGGLVARRSRVVKSKRFDHEEILVVRLFGVEIENLFWVNRIAHETSFKVEVWSSATSCASAQSDGLTCRHVLSLKDFYFGKVSINGFQSIVVANDHIVSVAASVVFGDAHFAVKGCTYRVSRVKCDVHAIVDAFPARTEMGSGDPIDWANKAFARDGDAVRHVGKRDAVGIDAFRAPSSIVDVIAWVVHVVIGYDAFIVFHVYFHVVGNDAIEKM